MSDQKADFCIIGVGAAGGVLAAGLAEAGFNVVGLEAGPHWKTEDDFASDELEGLKLFWNDPQISAGSDPVSLCVGKQGKGVGGSTVVYTMMALRLHQSDFNTRSIDGVGADWPINYEDLAPYYDRIERELPVSGPEYFPWGAFHGPYPQPPHVVDCLTQRFFDGCEKLGWRHSVCPLAMVTTYGTGDRWACTNRGFCEQGCKPKAKSSTLINFVPRAIAAGAEIKANCMAARINVDKRGLAKSVTYLKDGREFEQEAKVIIIAAYSIETPRLLLNSRSDLFPDGLANSSGLVGKNFMVHSDHLVYARFADPIRPYHAPPTVGLTQDFYETDPKNDYVRGFTLAPYASLPIDFAVGAATNRTDLWGSGLRDFMKDYNFYIRNGIIGEVLPYEHNAVTLTDELDHHGLPVPKVTFSYGENERKMIEAGYRRCEEVMEAAGALETFRTPATAHLLGTCRMGADPAASVTDEWGRCHDVPNLLIAGGSLFPTSGAVNPSLTIEALALRTAEHLIEDAKKGG